MVSSADDTGPEVGLTGARFGGSSRRRRTRAEPDPFRDRSPPTAPREVVPDAVVPDEKAVGLTGARFGRTARVRRKPGPATPAADGPPATATPTTTTPTTTTEATAAPDTGTRHPDPLPGVPLEPSPYTKVRPYVLTGGRTRPGVHLAVEALVTAASGPPGPAEPVEHGRIRVLCAQPRSVAEVAALTGVPLGVARVLLGDMLAAGAIDVQCTADAEGPGLALMERVLAGLRRL